MVSDPDVDRYQGMPPSLGRENSALAIQGAVVAEILSFRQSGRSATAAADQRQPAKTQQKKCGGFRDDDGVIVKRHETVEGNDPAVHTGVGVQGIALVGDNSSAERRVGSECRRTADLPEDMVERIGTVDEID